VLQPRTPTAKRARVLKSVLIGTAGLLVVGLLAVSGFIALLGHSFDSSRHVLRNAFPAVRAPKATGVAANAVNVLMVGYDVDAKDAATPQFVGKPQADALMLVHIPADRSHIYVMSILRDSLVPVPGHGQQAANAALALGGVPLQIQTVEGLLGVRVDHVVSVSLDQLGSITDAMGGVTVRNRSSFQNDGYTFQPGTVRLDGKHALAYVRPGTGATGDAGRARAQAAYVRGVLRELLQAKTLLNPAALATVVSVLSPHLTVDQGFDSAYVAGLGVSLRNVRAGDITTFALPAPTARKVGPARVLEFDRSALEQVRQHLKNDSLDEYVP